MLLKLCDIRLLEAFRIRHAPSWLDYLVVRKVRNSSEQFRKLSQSEFLNAVQQLRDSLQKQPNKISVAQTIDSFALTCEAIRRVQGKQLYDVQIIAGLVMSSGAIAEMHTGEGKSLAALLPVALYGLRGKGAHVATANEYLAERDALEMGPVFETMGMTCSVILAKHSPQQKQASYQSDVTYGAGCEFGFDFLRDQLKLRQRQSMRLGNDHLLRLRRRSLPNLLANSRGHEFIVIDEADSVLIDEANSPLVISSANKGNNSQAEIFHQARSIADQLIEKTHFATDRRKRTLWLTRRGWEFAHQHAPPAHLRTLRRPWSEYIQQALQVKLFFARDVDYVVQENKIVIVDQNTGRLHPERTWRDGLHQAVEARERVDISAENPVEARLTRQRYFQLYKQRCGLTGTAMSAERELNEFYSFEVVCIPRNKPSRRKNLAPLYFPTELAKFNEIAEQAWERSKKGQPVLIGTRTIRQSRSIADILQRRGSHFRLLNGLQDQAEANIIAQAGQAGQITIATNMAGRGTDIRLSPEAKASGGLHVIATEHHASTRVDNQLIGRAGRQDDPGSSQFFVSAEDDLIATHDPALANEMSQIESKKGVQSIPFDQKILRLQQKVESDSLIARRFMVAQDHWLEQIQNSLARTG